jgi:hypothetical protein
MELAELHAKLKHIDDKAELDKRELMKAYITEHNPYKAGDIVTDHNGSIKIETIGFYLSYNNPCAFYNGISLKKDGTPKKKNERQRVYQFNLTE